MAGTLIGLDTVTVGLACIAVAGLGIGASIVMLIWTGHRRRSTHKSSRGHRGAF